MDFAMKTIGKIGLASMMLLLMVACDQGIEGKKKELEKKQQKVQSIQLEIKELEKEILAADPNYNQDEGNAVLVSFKSVEKGPFSHFVDVTGGVESRRNVIVSAEAGGLIEKVYKREGDEVKKGELILRVDNEALRKQILEVKTSLDLAKTLFERQKSLYEQNVGTEVQYLQAKNNKESLEARLANLQVNLNKTEIRAPFNGTLDQILVREGESLMPGMAVTRIVSLEEMYVKADVSESFVGKIQKGDQVEVRFPGLDLTINSTVAAVGQVIQQDNRTFAIEVRLPQSQKTIKPNALAVVRIKDYSTENAIVVPSNLIQRDNRGEFVFVALKENGKMKAHKVRVNRGLTYRNMTEILDGLAGDEVLIDQGNRDVSEGVKIQEAEPAV